MDGAVRGDSVRTDALAGAALILARRFSSGATMWSLAPAASEHARHVAVEFVHPVIIGKRALPAVSVAGPGPVAALRAVARPGDVMVAIGRGDDDVVVDALRRAPAWGLTSIWIGWGAEALAPELPGAIRLWTDDPEGSARFDGRLVLTYHLLWELTHVCFEHPGLLADADDCTDEICITCSDEGRLGEVVQLDGSHDAVVRTARGVERIDVSLVGDLRPDDLVLVHAGTALSIVVGASE
jgi:hypothetical protein